MAYLHGAYGELMASDLSVVSGAGTLPVYFGVAPVHQLADYSGAVGIPLVIGTAASARKAVGYCSNWESFSLSEPVYVHMMGADPIGPIVLVNILDPDTHRASIQTTKSVTFANKKATISTDMAILSTVSIADKTKGTDYTVAYNADGTAIVITDLTTAGMSGSVSVSFYEVDLTNITAENIGSLISSSIGMVYQASGKVPALLAAPGWSDQKAVNDALKLAAAKINGHWNAFVFSDIDVSSTKTIDAAITKKATDQRVSEIESPCWPMATDGTRYYHLSTLAIARSQVVDAANDNVPFETVSNKVIPISGLVIKGSGGYDAIRFDKQEANRLNAVGIKTAIYWGGTWRLWGPHTGAYSYDGTTAAESIFDCGVRMAQYLSNGFQHRNGDYVDKPMHRAMIDSILDAEQEELDRLINMGAILYGKITFVEDSNATSDIIQGQFVLDAQYTITPPGRAIIGRYRYTTAGLETLTEGGEG